MDVVLFSVRHGAKEVIDAFNHKVLSSPPHLILPLRGLTTQECLVVGSHVILKALGAYGIPGADIPNDKPGGILFFAEEFPRPKYIRPNVALAIGNLVSILTEPSFVDRVNDFSKRVENARTAAHIKPSFFTSLVYALVCSAFRDDADSQSRFVTVGADNFVVYEQIGRERIRSVVTNGWALCDRRLFVPLPSAPKKVVIVVDSSSDESSSEESGTGGLFASM